MGMSPDFDHCELHVTIKNFFTAKPYVDSNSALTTRDMPIESCDIVDQMYEPGRGAFSTCTVVFPSLIENPKLRPLLQLIQEGDRIEIFHLQGDVGDPVFAGWIPPGGITVEEGKVRLDCGDAISRGKWDRLKRYETFNTNASGYYTRAMSRWVNILNEDFSQPTLDANAYSITGLGAASAVFGSGGLQLTLSSPAHTADIFPNQGIANLQNFPIIAGTSILCEAVANFTSFPLTNGEFQLVLGITSQDPAVGGESNAGTIYYQGTNSISPGTMTNTFFLSSTNGGTSQTVPQSSGFTLVPATQPGLVTVALLVNVNSDRTMSITLFVNYIAVQAMTTSKAPTATYMFPYIAWNASNASAVVSSWRASYLQPWISRAARFNPQTTDASTASSAGSANAAFTANADDNITFFDTFVELDYAEYRPIYRQYPQMDEIELDRYYTLGSNASQYLGQDQPSNAVMISPIAAGMQPPIYLLSGQPFRLEEGWNLTAYPKIQKKQATHSNDVVRMGAGTIDAQAFAERFLVSEIGNPVLLAAANAGGFNVPTGTGTPLFPRFETVVNDDRTSLATIIQNLADNDLAVRTDNVPSLQLDFAENIQYAFRYRAGDFVRVKTQSLINNLDQDMRIMQIQHKHGSPSRSVIVGHLPFDPNNLSMLSQDMVEAWLYNQAGSSPLTYVYPYLGSIAATTYASDFLIQLDALTTGTAIVYAALHWFTAASPVSSIQIEVSGQTVNAGTPGGAVTTTSATTDSGLINVTGLFGQPGTYHFAAHNTSGSPITLTGCFLVLKVKS
jgi:hypothetical protein